MRFLFFNCRASVCVGIGFLISLNFSSALPNSLSQLPQDHTVAGSKVVVWATTNISKGSKIMDGDLQERVIDCAGGPSNSVGCRRQVVGRIAKYAIENGEIILESELEGPSGAVQCSSKNISDCKGASYVVARRVIHSGAKIESNDLETRWTSAMKANPRWLPRQDNLVGLRSNLLIPKGTIFTIEFASSLSAGSAAKHH